MGAAKSSLNWLCKNIEDHLDQIDAVLADILDETAGPQAVEAAEPWVERLVEGRRGLQVTLAQIERQMRRQVAQNSA